MKNLFKLLFISLFALNIVACSEDEAVVPHNTHKLSIQLEAFEPIGSDVEVKLVSNTGVVYEAQTRENSVAIFNVPVGIYEASASFTKLIKEKEYLFNGVKSGITIKQDWNESSIVSLECVESRLGDVIIKELYVGGCQNNDNSKTFHGDKYVILHNKLNKDVVLNNLCLGIGSPSNGHASNKDIDSLGNLVYAHEDWITALQAIIYIEKKVTIPAHSDITIVLNGAIDNTLTYTNSVDLSSADYVLYDKTIFTHPTYHPAPSGSIPTSNYFKPAMYGLGNSWMISTSSPAFYIFNMEGENTQEYVTNPSNWHYAGGVINSFNKLVKIPRAWVLDAIEVYDASKKNESMKRLTPDLDAGYACLTNSQGYTLYRNVNKKATEAIETNKGKLVYNYSLGTENMDNGSTDSSGIDAEASIKNGATIIYMDTNNSSNDFHQRSKSSLKE